MRSLASRYAGRGESFEDLVQVGSIGLLLAIERFDTERGVQFATYAVPTIVGEIQRHFRDRTWALHVPRRMKELSLRLTRTIESATADLGRAPTIAELAKLTGIDEDEVVEALETYHAYSARSLSQPLGQDAQGEETMQDVLGAEELGYEEVEDGALVEAGMAALDPRERLIVELRFFEGLTQSEIAARVGISQMHVSRLLRRALVTMQGRLEESFAGGRRDRRTRRRRRRHETVRLTMPARAEYLILARLALAGIAREVAMSEDGARRPQARGHRGLRQRRAPRVSRDGAASPAPCGSSTRSAPTRSRSPSRTRAPASRSRSCPTTRSPTTIRPRAAWASRSSAPSWTSSWSRSAPARAARSSACASGLA